MSIQRQVARAIARKTGMKQRPNAKGTPNRHVRTIMIDGKPVQYHNTKGVCACQS